MRAKRAPRSPNNLFLNFVVFFNFLTPSSIYSSFFPSSGVLGTFFHLDGDSQAICGQFWAGFGQLLAVFGDFLGIFSVDFVGGILVPFLSGFLALFFPSR
jgi:hypothetical protein